MNISVLASLFKIESDDIPSLTFHPQSQLQMALQNCLQLREGPLYLNIDQPLDMG